MGRPTSLAVARALTINPASDSGPCTVTENSFSLLVSFCAFSCPQSEFAARAVIPARAILANMLGCEMTLLLRRSPPFRFLILCLPVPHELRGLHGKSSAHSTPDALSTRAASLSVRQSHY